MLKSATSPDPIQMRLRLNKKNWNKQVSIFINDLINFKKTINGAPSKFFPEKGNIKNPIPADPATIIGVLASDFQEITQKGNAIIEEQLNYSKNRRKSQPKALNTPLPATAPGNDVTPPVLTGPDLTKQLAANYASKYELIVEGSNFLTRFIARLTNPPIGFSEAAQIRRARMDLLDTCVKVYKGLLKLQVEVVKSSKDSIPASNKLLHEIWNNWSLVFRGFNAYKANMPASVPDSGGKIPEPQEIAEEKQKAKESLQEPPRIEETPDNPAAPVPGDYDYNKPSMQPLPAPPVVDGATSTVIKNIMEAAKIAMTDYSKNYRKMDNKNMGGYDVQMENFIIQFRLSQGPYKPIYARKLLEEYRKIINSLNQALGTSGSTMADIFKQNQVKEKTVKRVSPAPAPPVVQNANAQLETVAQAILRKWLGKTIHKLSPFDKTSNIRLQIYEIAEKARKSIDQIMNALEKDMNVEELNVLISETNRSFSLIRGLMRSLHLTNPMAKGKGVGGVETGLMDAFNNIM